MSYEVKVNWVHKVTNGPQGHFTESWDAEEDESDYDVADRIFFYYFWGNGTIDFNRALMIDELDASDFKAEQTTLEGSIEFVVLEVYKDGKLIAESGDNKPEVYHVPEPMIPPEVKAFWERKTIRTEMTKLL